MANVKPSGAPADTMPVSSLSGVSPGGVREAQLHKLGIYTVGDLYVTIRAATSFAAML